MQSHITGTHQRTQWNSVFKGLWTQNISCLLPHQDTSSPVFVKHPESKAVNLNSIRWNWPLRRVLIITMSTVKEWHQGYSRFLAKDVGSWNHHLFSLHFTWKAPEVHFPQKPGLLVPWFCTEYEPQDDPTSMSSRLIPLTLCPDLCPWNLQEIWATTW